MFPKKTEALAGTALIFEYSQLPLMLYVFIEEAAIVVPLFSFFRHVFFGMYYFLFCTLPFQAWGFFWVPRGSQKEPPHRYSLVFGFLYGHRVESSRAPRAPLADLDCGFSGPAGLRGRI